MQTSKCFKGQSNILSTDVWGFFSGAGRALKNPYISM